MKKFFNKINNFYIFVILLAVVLLTHVDVVLAPVGHYFSPLNFGDLNYFVNIRQFAFENLSNCVFPFWTTKILCGVPFFANSESAIFYLPNLIFFLLPVSKAINFSFLLHFIVLGFGTFLWLDNKIKDKFVSLITAVIAVFGSNLYLHAAAAHLSNIITASWFPFLLYFYDKSFEKKSYLYIVPVSFVISLQIFAGHFQYAYYTALVSLIYVSVFCPNRYAFVTLISSYFISLFLTAVQLLPSFDFYLEGNRRLGGEVKAYSASSSLYYILSAFFPNFISHTRENFWEISLYFGTANILVLAVSLFHVFNKKILKNIFVVVFIYLLTFQPVSNLAEYVIPCFSWFRSPAKLLFFMFILLLPLYAYGIKYILLKRTELNRKFVWSLMAVSLIILIFNQPVFDFVLKNLNYQLPVNADDMKPLFVISVILMFVFSMLLYLKRYLSVKIILIFLMLAEPIAIMRIYSQTFAFHNVYKNEYAQQENFNEQSRIFYNLNFDLQGNGENLSAAYPDCIQNYDIFMKNLEKPFNINNILGLLRCRYIVNGKAEFINRVEEVAVKRLNRLNVFYNYQVEPDKRKIYEIMSDENFNIFDTVVLEKEPENFETSESGGGYVLRVLYFNENSIEFEIYTLQPAVILYSDNYSKGWTAYNMDEPQEKYEVICADYIYKAISVDKGYRRIKFEYKPPLFETGFKISLSSWLIFFGFCICFFIVRKIYI